MWIAFAFLSALFAGVTSILAKCGIRKTDSTVATAIRTAVVLVFSWAMVFIGAFIAVLVEVVGIPVLPFAIGVYLPVQLNACIMVGGLVRLALDKLKRSKEEKDAIVNDGVLFCSGMIAGEGLMGIVLALLAVFGLNSVIDLSGKLAIPAIVSNLGGLALFAIIILTLLKFSLWKKRT